MEQFNNKVVLITGGAAGIGLAAARQFADAGAHVVITGRREAPLLAPTQQHPHITHLVADAANPEDASRTVATVIERHGKLDVLINNAGAGALLSLADDVARAIFALAGAMGTWVTGQILTVDGGLNIT